MKMVLVFIYILQILLKVTWPIILLLFTLIFFVEVKIVCVTFVKGLN